jgi:hypothetical protein
VRRSCPTRIKIYSPVDRSVRKAIVILNGAHNHPVPPSEKISRTGKDVYKQAVEAIGLTGATVKKVDLGMIELY